jgi:hypothetical protein
MIRPSRPGVVHRRIGVTLIVVGVIFAQVLGLIRDDIAMDDVDKTLFVVLSWLAFFMIPRGIFLSWRGRQYATQADTERIITDSKPDVLYLRTFRSDRSTARYIFWMLCNEAFLWSGLATEEEQLAAVLRPFGDLVAIGQPGESLPKPGAVRLYASDEEWKEVVKHQIRAARLVVLRAGMGENLLWELKQTIETLNPQKVLILVLSMKVKHYESFRTKANSVLDMPLPEGTTLRHFRRVSGFISFDQDGHFRRVSGFISFTQDGTPSFFPLRAPFFRRSLFRPYQPLFKFTLRPVFETFGLEWQPPPVSVYAVLSTIFIGSILFYIVFILVADMIGL